MLRIIGLDPGLRHTGWGVIEEQGSQLIYIGHGVIHSSSEAELGTRLAELFNGVNEIIQTFSPHEAAVEETFVNKNPTSTLKLGMARGAILLAPSLKGLPVGEYAANRVKKSVVGVGHANKDQVSMMVQRLLSRCPKVHTDGADALAVAICHTHYRKERFYDLKIA